MTKKEIVPTEDEIKEYNRLPKKLWYYNKKKIERSVFATIERCCKDVQGEIMDHIRDEKLIEYLSKKKYITIIKQNPLTVHLTEKGKIILFLRKHDILKEPHKYLNGSEKGRIELTEFEKMIIDPLYTLFDMENLLDYGCIPRSETRHFKLSERDEIDLRRSNARAVASMREEMGANICWDGSR